jgi:hypothetical protein
MHANGRHHDLSTKHRSRRVNRGDRQDVARALRTRDLELIEDTAFDTQARGRGIYDSC